MKRRRYNRTVISRGRRGGEAATNRFSDPKLQWSPSDPGREAASERNNRIRFDFLSNNLDELVINHARFPGRDTGKTAGAVKVPLAPGATLSAMSHSRRDPKRDPQSTWKNVRSEVVTRWFLRRKTEFGLPS